MNPSPWLDRIGGKWSAAIIFAAIVVVSFILSRLLARFPKGGDTMRLASALGSTPPEHFPEPTRRALAEASRRLDKGDTAGALALCAPLAGEDCSHAGILMVHAGMLWRAGQRLLSLRQIERAYALEPYKPQLAFVLYVEYRAVGQSERGEEVVRSTLSHPETSPGVAVVLAEAFAELGMHEAELMCWECAARLDPSERAFANNRCNALGLLRRFEEQLAGLEEAATRFPDDDVIAAQRVEALLWLGRLDEATARGREVIQRWPAQVDVICYLSWSLLLDGEGEHVDGAEALLARTEEIKVSRQMARGLRGTKILLRFRRGKHAEGLKEIRALLEEERSEWGPRFPKLIPADQRSYHGTHRLLEAMFLAALGRPQEARAAFRQGLKHNPDPRVVELARSALNTGRA